MCPRNPCAILATTLVLCLGLAAPSHAGPSISVACAVPSGDCSKKKLWGKHMWKRDLTRTRWVDAKLLMASFRYSDLFGANFRRASMNQVDLSYGNRTRVNFRRAEMKGANLSHADFYGSNFRQANLEGATLIGTRLDNTNLFGANFKGATLIGVSFNGIRLCNTIQPDGAERDDNCPGNQGGNGGPGGGVCCFPGGKPKDTGKDEGDGNGPIIGDL
jgi:uncharacterized protein YjbI with pentapeptide repeats